MNGPGDSSADGHGSDLIAAPYARPSLARRRDKPQLSCHHCRRRKLRCDRLQPACSNCTSRDLECVYAGLHEASRPGETRPDVQDRLQHLETLVTSLMSRSGANADRQLPVRENSAPSTLASQPDPGTMSAHAAGLPYVSGDHWAAILESIEDLKDHFSREQEDNPSIGRADDVTSILATKKHALLLYTSGHHASREEIIAGMPPRNVVDRHLSCYFNRLGLAYYAVHAPSFLRQYQSFWDDPTKTPIMWIGLLFSMISLALLASDTPHDTDVSFYCQKVVQCLIMGEYTRAGPFSLETFIHYVHIEFSMHADAGGDLWYLLGLTVNLAMRAGYHRDPSNFTSNGSSSVSLEDEMKRRLWASVLLGDALISSQMGMPCMISESQWDTREPLNLDDDDLQDERKSGLMQHPKAETEYTRVLSVIAGRRIATVLGTISAATNKPGLEYTEVVRLDRLLTEAGDSIPPVLKMKPMDMSITDPPQVIMSRLFVAHMFLKGRLMLHRRYLFTSTPASEESRRACIGASLEVLDIQRILHEETQPGGQLEPMRWRVSSIMNHQFLIATMILCSVLHRHVHVAQEEDGNIRAALRNSLLIWQESVSVSREAARAAKAIGTVLKSSDEQGLEQVRKPRHDEGNTLAPSQIEGWAMYVDDTTHDQEEVGDDDQRPSNMLFGQIGYDAMLDDWLMPDSTDG